MVMAKTRKEINRDYWRKYYASHRTALNAARVSRRRKVSQPTAPPVEKGRKTLSPIPSPTIPAAIATVPPPVNPATARLLAGLATI